MVEEKRGVRSIKEQRSASLIYKPRLDPFGLPCWLSEMTKNQDWIYLKHNAAKPQSSFYGL